MKLSECFPKKSRLAVALLLIVSMLSLNYVSVIAQGSSYAVQSITVGPGVSTIIDLPSVAATVATSVATTTIAPHTAATTVATTAGTSVATTAGTTVATSAATTVGTTVSTSIGTTTATTATTVATTATGTNTFRPGMAQGDFSIDLSSVSLSVAQGSSGNVQVSVSSYNYASPVSLTFSGTSGITGLFSNNPVATSPGFSYYYLQYGPQYGPTIGATSMLSISVPTSIALGLYPVTITGSSASFYHSVTLALTVMPTMASSINSVNIANKQGIGPYLINGTGWTLYTFARDIPNNGTSNCTGNCIQNWPVFYTQNLTLSSGLNATRFTVIVRPDGTKQIAYNGWPLYYFRNDTRPGDTNGQGIANTWFATTYPAPFTTTTITTTAATTSTKTTNTGY